MAEAALKLKAEGHYVIADFIAPTPEARSLFPADFRVWVDTIKEGRFEDTNQMFVNPKNFDFHVTTQDAKNWAPKIIEEIKKWHTNGITKNQQAQMLGRWQPFHDGHYTLFKEIIKKLDKFVFKLEMYKVLMIILLILKL